MAVIPKFHTTVAQFPIDPADIALLNAGTSDTLNGIYAGQIVGLSSTGYIKKATATNAGTVVRPIGIAADSFATSAGHSAYSSNLIVNSGGARKSSQNRVSDYFNEALGSGSMGVYIVGGEFYTDMFVTSETFTVGGLVYANAAATSILATSGLLSTTSTNAATVGIITSGKAGYPSGVPGEFNVYGSDFSMPLDSFTGTGFVSFIMQL